MGRSTAVAGLRFTQKPAHPLLVCGTPGELRGELSISNESATKQTLKTMPFSSDKLFGAGRDVLKELKIATRIQPNQAGTLYFDIPIDPATPAGCYEATIQVGEEHQPLKVQVFEEIALYATPDEITLISHGERRFEREFAIENRGNVALALGSRSETTLFATDGSSGLLLIEKKSGCHAADDNSDEAQSPPCIVTLLHENVTLKPGEKRIIKGTIEIPGNLKPYRHYHASLELLTAQIDLHLYTREVQIK